LNWFGFDGIYVINHLYYEMIGLSFILLVQQYGSFKARCLKDLIIFDYEIIINK